MTKIPWTEQTINPIVGCSKVSPGCENCYAEKMASRLNTMYVSGYSDLIIKNWKWTGRTCFIESVLEKPLRRKKPTMYFVCSMGDFWHPSVEPFWRSRVYEVVRKCPQHIFQFLTKRPELIIDWPADLSNSWLGVTVENQAMADKRIPKLMQIPAAVRFVSVEPLLEGVEIEEYLPQYDYRPTYEYYRVVYPDCGDKPIKIKNGIDWVIIGCESGTGRRPCKQGWISSLRTECRHAGVPVFVKQIEVNGKVSKDPSEWPGHLRIQQWPILRE